MVFPGGSMIVHQPGDASQLHGVSSSHWLISVGLRKGDRSCDAELLSAIIPTKSTTSVWHVLVLVDGGIMRVHRFMIRRAC